MVRFAGMSTSRELEIYRVRATRNDQRIDHRDEILDYCYGTSVVRST